MSSFMNDQTTNGDLNRDDTEQLKKQSASRVQSSIRNITYK